MLVKHTTPKEIASYLTIVIQKEKRHNYVPLRFLGRLAPTDVAY